MTNEHIEQAIREVDESSAVTWAGKGGARERLRTALAAKPEPATVGGVTREQIAATVAAPDLMARKTIWAEILESDREHYRMVADAILALFPPAPSTVGTVEAHTVTLDYADGYPSTQFNCNAAPDALCHAEWSCDCEQMYDMQMRNGVPAHRPDYHDPDAWHAGTFRAECHLREWYDGMEENLRGSVEVPVTDVWEGDFYTFTLTPATTSDVGAEQAWDECVAVIEAKFFSGPTKDMVLGWLTNPYRAASAKGDGK